MHTVINKTIRIHEVSCPFWITEVLSFSGEYSMIGRSLLPKVTQHQQVRGQFVATLWGRGHLPIQPTILLEFVQHKLTVHSLPVSWLKITIELSQIHTLAQHISKVAPYLSSAKTNSGTMLSG